MKAKPSFWDSPYFIREPDNWHLTEDAPDELKKQFAEYMRDEPFPDTQLTEIIVSMYDKNKKNDKELRLI